MQEACYAFWRTHLNNGRNSESLAAFMRPTDEESLEKQRATEAAEKKEHRLQQSRIHSFFRRPQTYNQAQSSSTSQTYNQAQSSSREKALKPAQSSSTSPSSYEEEPSEELLAFISSIKGDPSAFKNAANVAKAFEGIPQIYHDLKGALADYESQSLRKCPKSELGKDLAGYNLVAKKLVDSILAYCAALIQTRHSTSLQDISDNGIQFSGALSDMFQTVVRYRGFVSDKKIMSKLNKRLRQFGRKNVLKKRAGPSVKVQCKCGALLPWTYAEDRLIQTMNSA